MKASNSQGLTFPQFPFPLVTKKTGVGLDAYLIISCTIYLIELVPKDAQHLGRTAGQKRLGDYTTIWGPT